MNPNYRLLSAFVFVVLIAGAAAAIAQEDSEGCKDHPLFTCMPNFSIRLCEGSDFDRHEFSSEQGPIAVEGKKTVLHYLLK